MAKCRVAFSATKNKQKKSKGRRSKTAKEESLGVSGSGSQLVPYNPMMLYTDSMKLTVPVKSEVVIMRSYIDSSVGQSSSAITYNARNFTFAQIGDYTNLAAVFDQYKILAVEVLYQPRNNFENAAVNLGRFHTVLDYDDSTVLTSVSQATNYENCITGQNYQAQRRCLRPRIAVAAYSGSFTSYANMADQWIDVASASVQHYGVKEVFEQGTVSYLNAMDVEVRVALALRASR